jgi:hypothetical protein
MCHGLRRACAVPAVGWSNRVRLYLLPIVLLLIVAMRLKARLAAAQATCRGQVAQFARRITPQTDIAGITRRRVEAITLDLDTEAIRDRRTGVIRLRRRRGATRLRRLREAIRDGRTRLHRVVVRPEDTVAAILTVGAVAIPPAVVVDTAAAVDTAEDDSRKTNLDLQRHPEMDGVLFFSGGGSLIKDSASIKGSANHQGSAISDRPLHFRI